MGKPNIILLVIDTLREDYSKDLDALGELGFVKYENAIAPAPWTLPSHVSMFTGHYPSIHGIHESYGVYIGEKMAELSARRMNEMNYGLLGELSRDGYNAYIITANPFITPLYGFETTKKSIHLRGFLYSLDDAYLHDLLLKQGKSHARLIRYLLRNGQMWMALKGAYYFARSKLDQAFTRLELTERPILEKGSNLILDILSDGLEGGKRTGVDFRDNFFLFINMMEAHAPYVAGDIDDSLSINAFLHAVFKGDPPRDAVEIWRRRYPIHSRYAVRRAVEIIHKLRPILDNSLVIVTSDHGELLGDGGFSHGYFLEDGVLRVPLYIKWPRDVRPAVQSKPFISLTQIPLIIRSTVDGSTRDLGSKIAIAESFGVPHDYTKRLEVDQRNIRNVFSHRVKIYLEKGWLVYNEGADAVEKRRGMDEEEAKEMARHLLQGY